MPPLTPDQLRQRWTSLKNRRSQYDPLFEDCATYFRPSQLGFRGDTPLTEGQKRTEALFDGTGIDAVETLALSLAGGLSNEAIRWFGLTTTNADLNRDDAVAEWLEATTTKLLTALSQSNFYAEILEVYEDLAAFGQAALLVEELPITGPGFQGLRFEAWPLRSVWVAENAQQEIDTVFHRVDTTASAAAAEPAWADTLPQTIRDTAVTAPDQTVELLYAAYPDPDRPGRWVTQVLELGRKVVLEAGVAFELPVLCPRWRTATGEVYGRGPGHTALPDMKSLNRLTYLELAALGKVVDPPLKATDRAVTSTVRLKAGGVTFIRPGATLEELQPNLAKFSISDHGRQRLEQKIHRVFFQDALQLRDTGPEMTAREVIVRYEIMQRRFAPTLGRLVPNLFTTLIERVFGLLWRAGALDPLPPQLEGVEWTVTYESPLARAQRLSEVDSLQAFIAVDVPTVASVFGASALDVVDGDEALRQLAERRGIPATLTRDRRQVEERRRVAADLARQQQAKDDASQFAEAMGKLAPMVTAQERAGVGVVGTA